MVKNLISVFLCTPAAAAVTIYPRITYMDRGRDTHINPDWTILQLLLLWAHNRDIFTMLGFYSRSDSFAHLDHISNVP